MDTDSSKGQVLRGHTPQSTTTVHGSSAVAFGAPFLGMGVFIILISMGVIPAKKSSFHAPHWVVGVCGTIFAAPGAWLMLHGLRGIRAERRARVIRDGYPDEPWRADYRWNEQGAADAQRRGVGQMLWGMLFMILFASPMNYIAYQSTSQGAKIGYAFACIDFFVAIYVIAFFYRLARWIKYGTAQLQFRRFPFLLGQKLEVSFVPARSLEGVGNLVCTLRCIREAYETRQENGKTQTKIVSYELFSQSREINAVHVCQSFDRAVELSFDLPPDGQETRLSERPPTYWQLEIAAQASGVNLNSRFLVPVYANGTTHRTAARN